MKDTERLCARFLFALLLKLRVQNGTIVTYQQCICPLMMKKRKKRGIAAHGMYHNQGDTINLDWSPWAPTPDWDWQRYLYTAVQQ